MLFKESLDKNNTGMVHYEDFTAIGSEIVFGYFLKSQVENKIHNKDEEFLIEAILILYNHEIHDITKNIV